MLRCISQFMMRGSAAHGLSCKSSNILNWGICSLFRKSRERLLATVNFDNSDNL